MIEADLVDCMVAMPGQLFYSTQIPVCLWFLARDKRNQKFRDRRGELLFIDVRKLGKLIDRVHRDLTDEDIAQIANTYHAWKSAAEGDGGAIHERAIHESPLRYANIAGFCKSVTMDEIRAQGYVLTPGRYVGAADLEEDDEPFEKKMARLTKELDAQFEESNKLEKLIKVNIQKMKYE